MILFKKISWKSWKICSNNELVKSKLHLLDPDPHIEYGSGSGSRRRFEYLRIHPDPKHCFRINFTTVGITTQPITKPNLANCNGVRACGPRLEKKDRYGLTATELPFLPAPGEQQAGREHLPVLTWPRRYIYSHYGCEYIWKGSYFQTFSLNKPIFWNCSHIKQIESIGTGSLWAGFSLKPVTVWQKKYTFLRKNG